MWAIVVSSSMIYGSSADAVQSQQDRCQVRLKRGQAYTTQFAARLNTACPQNGRLSVLMPVYVAAETAHDLQRSSARFRIMP